PARRASCGRLETGADPVPEALAHRLLDRVLVQARGHECRVVLGGRTVVEDGGVAGGPGVVTTVDGTVVGRQLLDAVHRREIRSAAARVGDLGAVAVAVVADVPR